MVTHGDTITMASAGWQGHVPDGSVDPRDLTLPAPSMLRQESSTRDEPIHPESSPWKSYAQEHGMQRLDRQQPLYPTNGHQQPYAQNYSMQRLDDQQPVVRGPQQPLYPTNSHQQPYAQKYSMRRLDNQQPAGIGPPQPVHSDDIHQQDQRSFMPREYFEQQGQRTYEQAADENHQHWHPANQGFTFLPDNFTGQNQNFLAQGYQGDLLEHSDFVGQPATPLQQSQQDRLLQQGWFTQPHHSMQQNTFVNFVSDHAQVNHRPQFYNGPTNNRTAPRNAYHVAATTSNNAIGLVTDQTSAISHTNLQRDNQPTTAETKSERQIKDLLSQVYYFGSSEDAMREFWAVRRKHVNLPEGQSADIELISENRDHYINLIYEAMMSFRDPEVRNIQQGAKLALEKLINDMMREKTGAEVHQYMSAASAVFVDNLVKQYTDGDRFWKTSKSARDRQLNAVDRMKACLSGLRSEPRIVMDVLSSFEKMVEFIAEPVRQTAMKSANAKGVEKKKVVLQAGKSALESSAAQETQRSTGLGTGMITTSSPENVSANPTTAVINNVERTVQDAQDHSNSSSLADHPRRSKKVRKQY